VPDSANPHIFPHSLGVLFCDMMKMMKKKKRASVEEKKGSSRIPIKQHIMTSDACMTVVQQALHCSA